MTRRNIMQYRFLAALVLFAAAAPLIAADAPQPVAPKRPLAPDHRLVIRVYDIRAWTTPVYDFSLDSSAHSAAFITPANIQAGTFDYQRTGQRYPSRVERTDITREEKIDALFSLIRDTVSPESLRDVGGTATLREMRDALVVRQTPENQRQIADLLRDLKEHQGDTVRTIADWVILPRADVSKITISRPAGDRTNLAPPEVDLAAIEKLSPSARRFHAELLCLNGQTVSYISGRERTLMANQTATFDANGGATIEPFVGNAGAGIALQVNSLVDHDHGMAVVTFFSTFNDPQNPGKPIPVRAIATTQTASGQRVMTSGTSANIREQNSVVQEFRTSVRIPLGIPLLVGSMTLEPTVKNAEAKELVLILTVQPAERAEHGKSE